MAGAIVRTVILLSASCSIAPASCRRWVGGLAVFPGLPRATLGYKMAPFSGLIFRILRKDFFKGDGRSIGTITRKLLTRHYKNEQICPLPLFTVFPSYRWQSGKYSIGYGAGYLAFSAGFRNGYFGQQDKVAEDANQYCG